MKGSIMLDILNTLLLIFGSFICVSYVTLSLIAAYSLRFYLYKNEFSAYDLLHGSPGAPSVSLIAPAYNEANTIVENVRSLLSLYYDKMEVIIVNDGSKDDTLQLLIDAYELQKVDFYIHQQLPCKTIRGVYKATNKAYAKLIVVDKENGGKADALNAGINVSSYDLINCIDVDCIIQHEAILNMVKPFLEENVRVIACGGTIRIANSCKIEDGELIEANIPENWVARFQTVEYLRAFLIGRIGWGKLNGLLLISGAMGMFYKEIVIACGGYNTNTVGEDMELIIRMRRYMTDQGLPCKVVYVPEPLCWTEAPSDFKILGRQRNRWMRGTIEVLWTHRKLLFNPKYGILGMLSFPYWLFFEWMAPIIEFLGYGYMIYLIFSSYDGWQLFVYLFIAAYLFSQMISFAAIFLEGITYNQYRKRGALLKLAIASMLEPFIYHPRTIYWAIKGNIDKIRGVSHWGEMTRKGFSQSTSKKV